MLKENYVLVEEENPSEEIVIAKEELNGIDIDDIGYLEDLLRIMFIHEECGNLKVFADGGEKPGVLQTYRCPLCDKYFGREHFFNKDVEYCESVR